MKFKKVSIIIPVYNEEASLDKIISRVLYSNTLNLKKEIIIVNDGSSDKSGHILDQLPLKDKNIEKYIKIYHHRRNKGKGTAIRTAIKNSTGDIIIIQDADLEYSPKEFPKLLRPIMDGKTKVVYGSRELSGKNEHSSIIFHVGGRLVTAVTNLLYKSNLTDEATGYKVFESKLLKSLPLRCQRFEFCPEVTGLLLKKHQRVLEVPISYDARHHNEGKKIKVWDGFEAIWTLVNIRFTKLK